MNSKELRQLARETLATQLRADTCDQGKCHASILILQMGADVDEQREQREAERLYYESQAKSLGGGSDIGLNRAGPAFIGKQAERISERGSR